MQGRELPVPNVVAGRIAGRRDIVALATTDRSVQLWALGGGNGGALGSLRGHPTAVKALSFNHTEDQVVTGCSGGSVWLWDSATFRQTLTFSGHRSECQVIEYHPFGNFFASGSSDTNVKIWDARDGRCVQTYRNHSAAISAVRFSPHGRWLATGDEEGIIRVFDLSTGKPLACLESHTGAITGVDFHPTDFFLLSASLDRTIKLWSCESAFVLAASSEPDTVAATQVRFGPTGGDLYVASAAAVKKFDLNSQQRRIACKSVEEVQWDNLLDLAVVEGEKVMSVTAAEAAVTFWSSPPQEPERVREVAKAEKRRELERKENSPPQKTSDSIQQPVGGSVKEVLSRRLLVVRSVCALWQEGKLKQAIDQVTACGDPAVFVTFLAALPGERTRTPMSIDSCQDLLKHVLDTGSLTGPVSPGSGLADGLSKLPFSTKLVLSKGVGATDCSFIVSTSLAAVQLLAKRFGPMISELSHLEAVDSAIDFAREERVRKAVSCRKLFRDLSEVIQADLISTKLLRREKEETIATIKVIQ